MKCINCGKKVVNKDKKYCPDAYCPPCTQKICTQAADMKREMKSRI